MPLFDGFIDPELDRGPFVLSHLDLRSCNIIVDERLYIQGIIDWEFTSTVPLQLFTPPSWTTGHDPMETSEQMPAEFYAMLLDKSTTDDLCQRLRREWYHEADAAADVAFHLAHMLRRPTDATDIFCDFFAHKDSDKHLDGMMTDFFGKKPGARVRGAMQGRAVCALYTALEGARAVRDQGGQAACPVQSFEGEMGLAIG